ncbi:MAG: hypothetical protein WCI62_00130, partial [Erysipelotrichaceae bacterium]
MKRSLNKILVYTLIYTSLIIYDEVLLRWVCKLEFTLFPFIFALLLSFGLAIITSLFKRTRIVMGVISFIILLLYGTQIFYFLFFDTFFMVYSLLNVTQVVTVFYGEIIILIKSNLWLLFLCLLPFLIFLGFKRFLSEKKYPFKTSLIYAAVWVLLFSLGIGSVYLTSHKENTVYDSLVYHPESIGSMRYLGAMMTMGVDITRLLVDNIPFVENAVREPDIIDPDPDPDPDPQPIVYKDNVLAIPFDSMIKNTTNKKLIALSSYFKGKTPTKQNIMTGKYKGYNLILITAEGFSYFSARQDITPTLY